MAKQKPDPKSAPGLVSVRLQLTPAEREAFRVLAASSPHKTMAVYARELVRAELRRTPAKPTGVGDGGMGKRP